MDVLSSFCRSSASFMGMKSSSSPPLSRQQAMGCGGDRVMCLERWVRVSTTAKLLHPTAAGNASRSPLVRGSRRRNLLQPCSDSRPGETSPVWEPRGSLALILGQPCSGCLPCVPPWSLLRGRSTAGGIQISLCIPP